MRAILIACAALALHPALIPPAAANPPADRERRVRVALALAAGETDPTCGQCREDVDEVRREALRDGRPVVLFVGGCPGGELAGAVSAAGGIPVKAPEYGGDDRPPAERRIVVLEPKADRSGFVRSEVPKGATAGELREKVKATAPPPAKRKPLDWQF